MKTCNVTSIDLDVYIEMDGRLVSVFALPPVYCNASLVLIEIIMYSRWSPEEPIEFCEYVILF